MPRTKKTVGDVADKFEERVAPKKRGGDRRSYVVKDENEDVTIRKRPRKAVVVEKKPYTAPPPSANKPKSFVEEAHMTFLRKLKSLSVDMIVGGTEDFVIGLDGKLPWHIPEDLKFFKEFTKRKIVIMGRKTYESLPVQLHNRLIVVITTNPSKVVHRFPNQEVIVANSPEDALRESFLAITEGYYKEIVVAGGGDIYNAMQYYCKRLIYVFNNKYVEAPTNRKTFYKPSTDFNEINSSQIFTDDHGVLVVKVYANVGRML